MAGKWSRPLGEHLRQTLVDHSIALAGPPGAFVLRPLLATAERTVRAASRAVILRGPIRAGFAIRAASDGSRRDARSILVRPLHAARAQRIERVSAVRRCYRDGRSCGRRSSSGETGIAEPTRQALRTRFALRAATATTAASADAMRECALQILLACAGQAERCSARHRGWRGCGRRRRRGRNWRRVWVRSYDLRVGRGRLLVLARKERAHEQQQRRDPGRFAHETKPTAACSNRRRRPPNGPLAAAPNSRARTRTSGLGHE